MKVELKGLHKVRRPLADGSVRYHFYAWRGGPKLVGEPGSQEFLASFAQAHAARRASTGDTLKVLIAEFQAGAEFRRLGSRTRSDYARYLGAIEQEFGDMPLAAVDDRKVRGVFLKWRDANSLHPRSADYGWTVLARLLAWAKDRTRIGHNPCEKAGRLFRSNRSDRIWTKDDIARFNAVASEPLKQALLLALWTGQRQGDLLRLTWTAYDGRSIKLRQGKGGRNVHIPLADAVKSKLMTMSRKRKATTILTNTRGLPWTESGFRASWRTACSKAGISDLHFHDLRGTFVSLMAESGASEAEIASITGHALGRVSRILDVYLHRSEALSENGIARLNKNVTSTKL